MMDVIKLNPMAKPTFDQQWELLEELVSSKNCNQFMFMDTISLIDETKICCYKNIVYRYYINLSEDGRLWLYNATERGYYSLDYDRQHFYNMIQLGGNPFLKFRETGRGKVVGYVYQGNCYCFECIQEASVGGNELILLPLYGDEMAKPKKCFICDQMIHGGLRTNESTEATGAIDCFREAENYQPEFV